MPLVSISCITYNHAPYLRECFEGFLSQKTSFDFEIILHDDASTDETQAIIKEYTQKHPDIFFPMYQTENQYSKGVRGIMARFNFPRCRGKYIALCEGDDYWTDPLKLQKQVDFLEENPDCVLSFTDINVLKFGVLESAKALSNKAKISRKEIPHLYIPTLTVLFRNVVQNIPSKLYETLMDASLFLYVSQFGLFGYIDDSTGVYRMHSQGLYSGSTALYKSTTSSKARIVAFKYLNNIDKIALAHRIIYLLKVQKGHELSNKMFFRSFRTRMQIMVYSFYINSHLVFKHLKSN